jgi:hypothetical protein
MPMFVNAIIDGNRYCGSTSLSCISGVGTKDISKVIRHYYPYRKFVKGMYNYEFEKVLQHFQISYEKEKIKNDCTLMCWIKYFQKKNCVYVLHVNKHFLVIKNDKVVCTQFNGKIGLLAKSKYLKTEVLNVYTIKSNPANLNIPVTHKHKVTWRKVKNICGKHNIDFSLTGDETHGTGWCFLSEEFIEKYYDGSDPWEDEHFFYTPEECLEQIKKDVIDKIKEKDIDKVSC